MILCCGHQQPISLVKMFEFRTKSLALEQTLYTNQISANRVCAINMMTEKFSGIYEEKLILAAQLYSYCKRNAIYDFGKVYYTAR